MHVERDLTQGTVSFVPTNDEERTALERVRALGANTKIPYRGRRGGGWKSPAFAIMFDVAGHELIVHGDDDESRRATGGIRDTCYCTTNGLIFLECDERGSATAYRFTGSRCQHCSRPMIDRTACGWKTCDACAAACAHEYTYGMVRGGGIDIGVGHYCGKCGRGKPDEAELPLDLHHALAKAHLAAHGIHAVILYDPS